MVKFPYNSGWLHDVWGSQAKILSLRTGESCPEVVLALRS
jgi:hypothetical protein